jgi:hypothetical protein
VTVGSVGKQVGKLQELMENIEGMKLFWENQVP